MADRHVMVDDRKFVVKLKPDGGVRGISERRIYASGTPYEAVYDKALYCPKKTHKKGQLQLWYRILAKMKESEK